MPLVSSASARAAFDAELALDRLALHEALAEQWEQEPYEVIRRQFAQSYRELVGVPPERREEFRAALERIADGGGMPVDAVIAHLNQTNGTF